MQILERLDIGTKYFDASVVTIGNFDGVHRGHVELFRHVKDRAARFGFPSVAVTFDPHPLTILAPESAPALITTFLQKAELISQSGIDYLAVINFTRDFSSIPAELFVRSHLCHAFGMRHMIIGHDYVFGQNRTGNFETLTRMGPELGFSVEDVEPFGEDSTIYSSSLVRRLIGCGDMTTAAVVLDRYYGISGRVVHGRAIGTQIGFPTANIVSENQLIPPDGVYAVMVSFGDALIKGACNIGNNPTFEGINRSIEVFLLDFDDQLYGENLDVSFIHRLRDTKKFPDTDSLISAIRLDVDASRNILESTRKEMIKPLCGRVNRGLE
jgi:riboflavin kinase/FMN adenylyltransferase